MLIDVTCRPTWLLSQVLWNQLAQRYHCHEPESNMTVVIRLPVYDVWGTSGEQLCVCG